MVEQTGEEIDWDRIPPDAEDFPEAVITALNIYNSLGNRVYPDIGYIGKDYTNLELLYKFFYIANNIATKSNKYYIGNIHSFKILFCKSTSYFIYPSYNFLFSFYILLPNI